VTDTNNLTQKSFHEFCRQKLIPKDIEEQFIDYFKSYFKLYFISSNEEILTFMIDNMEFSDIEIYWRVFVNALKHSLENYNELEIERIKKLK
jgi:hypothetical protein